MTINNKVTVTINWRSCMVQMT